MDQGNQGGTAVYMGMKGAQEQHGQRTWCVFDPCLVLPEYLVTFEYELSTSSQLQQEQVVVAASAQAAAAVLDKLPESLLRPTAVPLLPWVAVAAEQRAQLCSGHAEEQQWRQLLEQGPMPRQRPNLYIASEEMIRKHIIPADAQVRACRWDPC